MYSFQYSVHHTSKKPNTPSGDCYFVKSYGDTALISIADGLGSGPDARDAAQKMIDEIEKRAEAGNTPLSLLQEGNRSLHGSRGSVVGIAMIDNRNQQVAYAGIGNITCLVVTRERKKQYLISNPGFLNGRPFRAIERYLPFYPDDTIVLFSDGIELPNNWEYIIANGLSPEKTLKRLVQEMKRIDDDATLIVGKWYKEDSV